MLQDSTFQGSCCTLHRSAAVRRKRRATCDDQLPLSANNFCFVHRLLARFEQTIGGRLKWRVQGGCPSQPGNRPALVVPLSRRTNRGQEESCKEEGCSQEEGQEVEEEV